MRKRIQWA